MLNFAGVRFLCVGCPDIVVSVFLSAGCVSVAGVGIRGVSVESVKFGERCVVPGRSARLFRCGMPIPSQAVAEVAVVSRTVVSVTEGVEARRQTLCSLRSGMQCEGMVQTTNLKRAAKAEVGSIIPWLQVRILPVPVNQTGHFGCLPGCPVFIGSGC